MSTGNGHGRQHTHLLHLHFIIYDLFPSVVSALQKDSLPENYTNIHHTVYVPVPERHANVLFVVCEPRDLYFILADCNEIFH